MDYRDTCCKVESENTVGVKQIPIKDQLIVATNKLIDMRSLLLNIVEGISSGERPSDPNDKIPETECIKDSARNINMLIDQCMDLATDVHKLMF